MSSVIGGGLALRSTYRAAGHATPLFWAQAALMAYDIISTSSQKIYGPRLTDLGVQVAEEGAPLIRGWGTWRQAGTLWWSTGLIEHTHESGGGFGGPTYVNYDYTTGMGLIGGLGPITRPNRMWLNEKVMMAYSGPPEGGGGFIGYPLTFSDNCWSASQSITETVYWHGNPSIPLNVTTNDGSSLRIYNGLQTAPDPLLEADASGVFAAGRAPAKLGQWHAFIDNLNLSLTNNSVPNVTWELYNETRDLPSIITEIFTRREFRLGYSEDDLELSALAGLLVDGFVIDARKSAEEALGQLQYRYHFRLVEEDGVFKAKLLAAAPVATLTWSDLRWKTVGEETPKTTWTAGDSSQQTQTQEITSWAPERNYHPGISSASRQTLAADPSSSQQLESTALPMAMSQQERNALARTKLHQAETERRRHALQLGLDHFWLGAADNILIPTPIGYKTVRLPGLTRPLFGPLTSLACETDVSIFDPALLTEAPALPEPEIVTYGDSQLYVIDAPLVRDIDAGGPVLLVAATASKDTRYAALSFQFNDIGTVFAPMESWQTAELPAATCGVAVDALADFAGGSTIWDDDNSVTVDLWRGTPASASEDDLLNGANQGLLGSDENGYELFQWTVATALGEVPTGPGGNPMLRYRLEGRLLRGRHGSEFAIGTHAIGDTFILLNSAVRWVGVPLARLNSELEYSFSRRSMLVAENSITPAGVSMLPLAPQYVGRDSLKETSGDFEIAGQRMSRLVDTWYMTGGVTGNAPYDTDRIRIEILDGSDVVRTIETTADADGLFTESYAVAEQTTDFGSEQASITVRVQQWSDAVGWGHAAVVVVS